MTLVQQGDGWRIQGPGSDRARVAYAELAGDAVVYSLESASAPAVARSTPVP
jgi:hypothetical protein